MGTNGAILKILVPNISFLSMPSRFEWFPGTWEFIKWSEMGQRTLAIAAIE